MTKHGVKNPPNGVESPDSRPGGTAAGPVETGSSEPVSDVVASSEGAGVLRRGARGAFALAVRQLLVQGLSLVGAVVLARVLTPAEFGVYGITVFLMHFLVVFGDAGLAAGLVRESEEPDERDWRAVFTFQQVLVVGVSIVGAVVGPWMAVTIASETDLRPLVPATLAALVLASFQTVPIARLERRLDFGALAIVEVAQSVAFNVVAIACALAGLGTVTMAAALVARAAVGAVAVRFVAPLPLGWAWDWSRVKPRLGFGMSFQGASLLTLLRDAMLPVYVGALLGEAVVGGLFWARMLAAYPLIVVYMLQRLLLPLFARLQGHRGELRRAVELSLFAVAVLVVPAQTTIWALQEPLTRLVFGEQWLASLPVYRVFWFAVVLEPQLVVALALMNALGRADRTLRFFAWITVGTWVAGVPLLVLFGPTGYAMASLCMVGVKWSLVREADAASSVDSLRVVAPAWGAGLVSALVTMMLARIVEPTGLVALAALATAALVAYAAALAAFAPVRTRQALAWVRSEVGR